MKARVILMVASVVVAASLYPQQGKVKTEKTQEYLGSAFAWQYDCGGLSAETFTTDLGWHQATCMEIAKQLSDLRDWRNVGVSSKPDVASMLTYAQYGYHFEIDPADFEKAKLACRKLLADGFAVEEILVQCRSTVRGIVPYGLKLREKK